MASKRTEPSSFTKARRTFFNQGKEQNAPCWLCGQPIDYEAGQGTTADSHELDHYHPVSTHPELQHDPSNFRHAHKQCNRQRSNKRPLADLGERVAKWW